MLTPDEIQRLMAEVERGQQLAGHHPNPRALARARRIMTGEITHTEALAEIELELDRLALSRGLPMILTPHQVAELLQVPSRTLEDWRQTKAGPPYRKLGRHVRYEREALTEWVMER